VADVERYPEFLPLCESLRVLRRQDGPGEGTQVLVAEMGVGYKAIRERFTTRVSLDRPGTDPRVARLSHVLDHRSHRDGDSPSQGEAHLLQTCLIEEESGVGRAAAARQPRRDSVHHLVDLGLEVQMRDIQFRDRLQRARQRVLHFLAALRRAHLAPHLSQPSQHLRTVEALPLTVFAEIHGRMSPRVLARLYFF